MKENFQNDFRNLSLMVTMKNVRHLVIIVDILCNIYTYLM